MQSAVTTTLGKNWGWTRTMCRHRLLVALRTHLRCPKMTKKDTRKQSSQSLKAFSLKKGGSIKRSSDNYKVDHHNNRSRSVEVLEINNTFFTREMNLEASLLTIQSEKHDSHISGKIAKLERPRHVQMKSLIVSPSDTI